MTFQERNDLLNNISKQNFINIEFCNTVNVNSLEEMMKFMINLYKMVLKYQY